MNSPSFASEPLKMETWRHSTLRSGLLAFAIGGCVFAVTGVIDPLDPVVRRVNARTLQMTRSGAPPGDDLARIPSPRPYTVKVFCDVQDLVTGRRQDVVVVEFPQLELQYVRYDAP